MDDLQQRNERCDDNSSGVAGGKERWMDSSQWTVGRLVSQRWRISVFPDVLRSVQLFSSFAPSLLESARYSTTAASHCSCLAATSLDHSP